MHFRRKYRNLKNVSALTPHGAETEIWKNYSKNIKTLESPIIGVEVLDVPRGVTNLDE